MAPRLCFWGILLQIQRPFPPNLNPNSQTGLWGANKNVKWYSTLVLTIWFVSACEYAGNGSRYKA
jgi:hypothetical protein